VLPQEFAWPRTGSRAAGLKSPTGERAISRASGYGTSIVRHRGERHSRRYSFCGTRRACPKFFRCLMSYVNRCYLNRAEIRSSASDPAFTIRLRQQARRHQPWNLTEL